MVYDCRFLILCRENIIANDNFTMRRIQKVGFYIKENMKNKSHYFIFPLLLYAISRQLFVLGKYWRDKH